jgi:hypothetical protein
MDGSIRAESPISDGHGTRIVIRLPAAKDVAGTVPTG